MACFGGFAVYWWHVVAGKWSLLPLVEDFLRVWTRLHIQCIESKRIHTCSRCGAEIGCLEWKHTNFQGSQKTTLKHSASNRNKHRSSHRNWLQQWDLVVSKTRWLVPTVLKTGVHGFFRRIRGILVARSRRKLIAPSTWWRIFARANEATHTVYWVKKKRNLI